MYWLFSVVVKDYLVILFVLKLRDEAMKVEKVPADAIVIVRVLLFDSTATPEAS